MLNPSSSFSIILLWDIGFAASSTINNTLHVLAVAITCLPLPFPSLAPSIIPGRSITWILAPLKVSRPGTAVRVVNSYAATSLKAPVSLVKRVDLPTEGKPTKPTLVSPVLATSKPSPPPPPPGPLPPVNSSVFNLASFALSIPL